MFGSHARFKTRLKVNNISVMSGLLQEKGRERKEYLGRLKDPTPHPNLSQVKHISSCQQAKCGRVISLKAAAENATPYQVD